MATVVGVSIKQGSKIAYYDTDRLVLKPGDEVIVPTDKGIEFGRVMEAPRELPDEKLPEGIRKVIRRATDRDRQQQERNRARREEAYRKCLELIAKHQLPMKLVDVDYVFDGNSITFYFTAEGRVDFRELVKDLASALRTRIELRQVGVRDEAKIVGGLGPCGRILCCSLFLKQFDPVSIRMAKEQYLPLNPTKISGVCGRLMCCLRYEYEAYRRFNRRVPSIGSVIDYEGERATVISYDVVRERVILQNENGEKFHLPPDYFGPEPEEEEVLEEMEGMVEEDLSEEALGELDEE
jgi:cell fate regulator YaaT (PSP1 superfamily)